MPVAARAMPVNPNSAAMMATTRNKNAQRRSPNFVPRNVP